jgi:hypothetical protein
MDKKGTNEKYTPDVRELLEHMEKESLLSH